MRNLIPDSLSSAVQWQPGIRTSTSSFFLIAVSDARSSAIFVYPAKCHPCVHQTDPRYSVLSSKISFSKRSKARRRVLLPRVCPPLARVGYFGLHGLRHGVLHKGHLRNDVNRKT